MTRSDALRLAPLVPVILIAALPASASALVAQSATFEATLRGSQLETSSVPGDPDQPDDCPPVQTKENVNFHTPAPQLIDISYLGSEMFVFGHHLSSANIYTNGTVAREKNAVGCEGPDDPHKALDCGTRQFSRWRLTFQASGPDPHRNLELLDANPERTDPFDNCTPLSVHFPEVIWTGQRPTWILARVSKAEILDPQQRTIVLSADGTVSDRGESGGSYSNSLNWTLTLHRVDDELGFKAQSPSPITVGHRGGFTGRFFPPGATASSYTWQMKRAHQSHWTTLGTTATRPFHWTFRLAGHFHYRTIVHGARSPAGGPPRTIITRARRLEVRFPTRDRIVADSAVQSFTQEDGWERTLRLATEQSRREVGFWISLDTCQVPRGGRRYDHGRIFLGSPVGPDDDGSEVHIGPRPADDPPTPPAVIGCAEYTVASFHTHPPTTYQRGVAGSRPVGPSTTDDRIDRRDMVPGIVFDYLADPNLPGRIPFGYPKEKPALRYVTGLLHRPTPQR
jgi:hypothetical protein